MLGKEYGADAAFNPAADNIDEEIRKMTKGKGCDVYIEASGNAASYSDIYFADYHHINPSGDSVSSKTEYDHGLSDPFMQLYRKQSS